MLDDVPAPPVRADDRQFSVQGSDVQTDVGSRWPVAGRCVDPVRGALPETIHDRLHFVGGTPPARRPVVRSKIAGAAVSVAATMVETS
jgi:hypothetical protein